MTDEKEVVQFMVWNQETDEIETLTMDADDFKAMEEEEAKIAKKQKELRDYDDQLEYETWLLCGDRED